MTISHKHHIIPKHMGGSDDPSNIVELTVEEHAEAHKELYEKYNNEYDKIAWLGLSGQTSKQEVVKLSQSVGGKEGARRAKEQKKGLWSSETQAKNAKKTHNVCRENKTGFWSSEQQSENGKKSAKKVGLGTKTSGNNIRICCLGCLKDTTKPTFMAWHIKKCFQ